MKELCDEHHAQVHNYLNASGHRVALLVNFGHFPGVQIERITHFWLGDTFIACCFGNLSDVGSQETGAVKKSATVDAQPLLLLTERMSEALYTIGNPLSTSFRAGLKRVRILEGDEQVTSELQRLLDPECDFLIEIEKDGTIKPQLLKASFTMDRYCKARVLERRPSYSCSGLFALRKSYARE